MGAKERGKKRKQRKNKSEIMKKITKSTSKVSPQAFGKALSRMKHLPKSPERKVLVLTKTVKDLTPRKRNLCDNNLKQRKEKDKDRKKR